MGRSLGKGPLSASREPPGGSHILAGHDAVPAPRTGRAVATSREDTLASEQIAAEFIEAYNAADWGTFRALLAPDVVYAETGTERRVQGPDVYLELCRGWRQAFADSHGTIQQAFSSGNRVAQEITWTGTHTGPLVGPGGTVPASGK